MGRHIIVLPKGDPSLHCRVLGGRGLLNIESGPTFTGTVNGPKIIDLSKGDPLLSCSVLGCIEGGERTPDKHSIWADDCEDS